MFLVRRSLFPINTPSITSLISKRWIGSQKLIKPADESSESQDRSHNKPAKRTQSPRASKGQWLERVLHIRNVARVTKGGKIRSISALAIVGNQNGTAGFGLGKSSDAPVAIRKALDAAKKNMIHVERLDNRTIFSTIDQEFHGVKMQMRPARPGYGLVVNHNVHEVCRCLGISDLSGKMFGSNNPINVVRAVFEALANQQTPAQIAKMRGKKIVDVQKAYYGTSL